MPIGALDPGRELAHVERVAARILSEPVQDARRRVRQPRPRQLVDVLARELFERDVLDHVGRRQLPDEPLVT